MFQLIRFNIAVVFALGLITTGFITPAYSQTNVHIHQNYPPMDYYGHAYPYVIPTVYPGYYVHHSYEGEMYYNHPFPPTHHPYPGYRYKNIEGMY